MPLDPIIYANETEEIFVIDIPTSIASAQHAVDGAAEGQAQLLSCPPISKPYSSTEPKSSAASKNVTNHQNDVDIHAIYVNLVQQACAVVSQELKGARYCHERFVDSETSGTKSRKRKADQVSDAPLAASPTHSNAEGREPLTEQELENLLHSVSTNKSDLKWAIRDSYLEEDQYDTNFFHNSSEQTISLSPEHKSNQEAFHFQIPPHSAFLLSKCQDSVNLRRASRLYTPETKGRFDLILLDPPWPNRSARRKSSYSTLDSVNSVELLLAGLDLDTHILPGGFVAVWITNKSSFRNVILGPGGMFERWNVSLIEEWIWVKVTLSGEPILPLDGKWRKPYEVLLIGKAPPSSLMVSPRSESLKRRVLFAVPDLHSRKPCVRQLAERLLLQRHECYSALEVFGRYLLAGWLSWGDEVLKYNWQHYWR